MLLDLFVRNIVVTALALCGLWFDQTILTIAAAFAGGVILLFLKNPETGVRWAQTQVCEDYAYLLLGMSFTVLSVVLLRQDALWWFLLGAFLVIVPFVIGEGATESYPYDECLELEDFSRMATGVAGFGVMWGFCAFMLNVTASAPDRQRPHSYKSAYAEFFRELRTHLKAAYREA